MSEYHIGILLGLFLGLFHGMLLGAVIAKALRKPKPSQSENEHKLADQLVQVARELLAAKIEIAELLTRVRISRTDNEILRAELNDARKENSKPRNRDPRIIHNPFPPEN